MLVYVNWDDNYTLDTFWSRHIWINGRKIGWSWAWDVLLPLLSYIQKETHQNLTFHRLEFVMFSILQHELNQEMHFFFHLRNIDDKNQWQSKVSSYPHYMVKMNLLVRSHRYMNFHYDLTNRWWIYNSWCLWREGDIGF